MNLTVSLLLIGSTVAKANDAIFIEKDQKAPYSGVLFPEQQAGEIRKELLEADKVRVKLTSQTFKVENLSSTIQLKNEEIEQYKRANQRLIESEKTSESMKMIWFGLGVLATGAAVYGAGALSR